MDRINNGTNKAPYGQSITLGRFLTPRQMAEYQRRIEWHEENFALQAQRFRVPTRSDISDIVIAGLHGEERHALAADNNSRSEFAGGHPASFIEDHSDRRNAWNPAMRDVVDALESIDREHDPTFVLFIARPELSNASRDTHPDGDKVRMHAFASRYVKNMLHVPAVASFLAETRGSFLELLAKPHSRAFQNRLATFQSATDVQRIPVVPVARFPVNFPRYLEINDQRIARAISPNEKPPMFVPKQPTPPPWPASDTISGSELRSDANGQEFTWHASTPAGSPASTSPVPSSLHTLYPDLANHRNMSGPRSPLIYPSKTPPHANFDPFSLRSPSSIASSTATEETGLSWASGIADSVENDPHIELALVNFTPSVRAYAKFSRWSEAQLIILNVALSTSGNDAQKALSTIMRVLELSEEVAKFLIFAHLAHL